MVNMVNTAQINSGNRTSEFGKRSGNAGPPVNNRRSAFTLIELLTVIAIIALLAGLVVGGTRYASTKIKESRIRAELNALATAIDAYHAKFNSYPPDNVDPVTKIVNPITNSLYYELTGTIVDPDGKPRFRLPNRQQWIGTSVINNYFHADGFLNAGPTPKDIKQFASLKSEQHKPIVKSPVEVEVLTVPVDWPLKKAGLPPPFNSPDPAVQRVNPWRYVCTQPTNNPATFDLWAEYVEGGKVRVICNWSKDVLERGQ